jgi:hypothetical protein
MTLPDLIDAAPDFLQDASTEVATALAVVSQAFRDLGFPVTAEDAYPYVSLILERADADLALFAEGDGEDDGDEEG